MLDGKAKLQQIIVFYSGSEWSCIWKRALGS